MKQTLTNIMDRCGDLHGRGKGKLFPIKKKKSSALDSLQWMAIMKFSRRDSGNEFILKCVCGGIYAEDTGHFQLI